VPVASSDFLGASQLEELSRYISTYWMVMEA